MRILRVHMGTGDVAIVDLPLDRLVGGRALIDQLMMEYMDPAVHPLSQESLFIIAPGLLAGSNAPQSGRLSVGGKSPLTGGIKESNSGGVLGHMLGRLGIRGILVKGKSNSWKILRISKEEVTLEVGQDIAGLKNYEACTRLRQRYGAGVGIAIAGIAGEMRLLSATVAVTDTDGRPSRHAGRGGLGALMGAKGLKAIVVDDSGTSVRRPSGAALFKTAVREAVEFIENHPLTKPFRTFGTNFALDTDNARGSLPTNNHRQGSFDHFESINGAKLHDIVLTRGGSFGHGCMPGCIVRCSNVYNDLDHNFLTAGFEYETIAMLGANLGISDIDSIARMERLCDEIGIDTIELGCTIGVLNEVGLFTFGDAEKAYSYVEEIENGTSLGRILGSGVSTTAKVFGIDRVPAVKGQGIPAHSARSCKGWGVTYATSPQGADHTAGPVLEEPLSNQGQVQRSRMSQIAMAGIDSAGLCMLTRLMAQPAIVVSMINGLYGTDWSLNDYLEMAKQALRQERKFNRAAGISEGEDRLPSWMRKEPLSPTNAVFDVPQDEMDELFNF